MSAGAGVGGGMLAANAQRQREAEALAALQALQRPRQGMMPAPWGLPQAPPLPRGEPARPGGYLPPVPPNVPRMRPPTSLEQLRQSITDYQGREEDPYAVGVRVQEAIDLLDRLGGVPEKAAMSAPRDLAENVGGIADLGLEIAQNPELLSQMAATLGVGTFAGGLGLNERGEEALLPEGVREAMKAPRAIGQYYQDAYGSLDKILSSLENRPVGAGLDFADVLDLTPQLAMMPLFKGSRPMTKWLAERGPLPGRGPVTPKEAIVRQVVAELFNNEGNVRKALANIDEVGVTGKNLDTAVEAGKSLYGETMSRAHDMDIPGAGIPVAHPDMQRHIVDVGLTVPDSTLWYPNATEGYRTILSGDPLAPPLISVTSSGINPYGNTDRGLPILAGHRAGIPMSQVFNDFKMQGSVTGQAQRVLDAEDIFAAMPYGTDAESMASFDHWIRNAPESEVQRLLKKETGVFPTPKTFNFWRNNAGDNRFFTTDSWQGRNAGFSLWDPDVVVQTKNKDPKTGEYKKKIGGWIAPDESQYYSREARSPKKQEKGIPLQSEINLIEDFMTHYLAPEYNLDPSAVQAAHWIGGMKMFDRMPDAHLAAPYGHQLDWRLRYAGVPNRGLGDVRPPSEWEQVYEAMLRNKLAKGDQHIIFGKGDPRLKW